MVKKFSPILWQMMTCLNPLDALIRKVPFSLFAKFWVRVTSGVRRSVSVGFLESPQLSLFFGVGASQSIDPPIASPPTPVLRRARAFSALGSRPRCGPITPSPAGVQVWISGLFNPMAFLTVVMQTTARKNNFPLDKMVLQTEVLKKFEPEITAAPREGAHIHGLFLEGAKWDLAQVWGEGRGTL